MWKSGYRSFTNLTKISVVCETLNLSLEGEATSQIIDRIVIECLQNLIVTEKGE